MHQALFRRGLGMAAALSALVLASCETPEPEPPAPPPPPPPPPALALNSGISEAAAIYVAFMREARTIDPAITDAATIELIMTRGASYESNQLSRGMIAYGAILALQSTAFVEGVRTYAADPDQRRQVIERIQIDPAYAAQLPGAADAAGLIVSTLRSDSEALAAIAHVVAEDAYTIQERNDPRRRWAQQAVPDRDSRLETVRRLSEAQMIPNAEDAARLYAAAHDGAGLGVTADDLQPPYTPAVANSLAIAALAALGAGGDDWRPNTDALTLERNSQFCLSMSKLNLYQCIAAARPHYEHMFCAGRHVMGDLAVCTAEAVTPEPLVLPTALAQSTPVAADAAATSIEAIENGAASPN
jgi:hypothetical protein